MSKTPTLSQNAREGWGNRLSLIALAHRSETEQVADLHEQLSTVVEIAGAGAADEAGRTQSGGDDVQVAQVAVVSGVDRRTRMDEIGDQKIGIEFPRRGQV